jgi:hypothetical protein
MTRLGPPPGPTLILAGNVLIDGLATVPPAVAPALSPPTIGLSGPAKTKSPAVGVVVVSALVTAEPVAEPVALSLLTTGVAVPLSLTGTAGGSAFDDELPAVAPALAPPLTPPPTCIG